MALIGCLLTLDPPPLPREVHSSTHGFRWVDLCTSLPLPDLCMQGIPFHLVHEVYWVLSLRGSITTERSWYCTEIGIREPMGVKKLTHTPTQTGERFIDLWVIMGGFSGSTI
jgi:hypothetical protein